MIEFEPHDYFTGISDGYTSRETLQEHVRKTYDQIRELADHIDLMLEELTHQSEELEEKEIGRESAESVRVANETERLSKDSDRDSKIEAVEVRIEENEDDLAQHKIAYANDQGTFQANLDGKANKQQEDWITPTFLNGFTGNVRYRKTQFNQLEIYGTIISVNPITNTPLGVFSLPTGYRPTRDIKFEAPENAFYTFRNARMAYSDYEKLIYIYAGQGGSSWYINITIPLT